MASEERSEFVNRNFEILNDAAQGLPLQDRARVNGDDHPRTILLADVNYVTAALAAEFKPELLSDTSRFLPANYRKLRAHTRIST
ncbi:MAG: hypothetical protein ACRD24_10170, partial [Terriglobales bacterium]